MVRQTMLDDPFLAHGWHCNIAMAVADSFNNKDSFDHSCNKAASCFMHRAFDVKTTKMFEGAEEVDVAS